MAQTIEATAAQHERRTRDRSWLVPIGVGLLVGVVVWVLRSGIWYWGVDFSAYRAGGSALLHGRPIYGASGTSTVSGIFFIYTPFAALLLSPLSLPSAATAMIIWTVLNGALLGAICWLSLGMVGIPAGRARAVAASIGAAAAVPLIPVTLNFELGQINLVLLVLILLDFSQVMPERWRGIAVGIVAGMKLIPLIFVAYWWLTGRRRPAVRAGAVFAGATLLGFAVAPASSVSYWFGGVFADTSRMVPLPYIVNHSLAGLVARMLERSTPPHWALLVSAAALVAGLAGAVWAWRRGQDLLGLLIAAFTANLVSPVVWPAYNVWAIPLLAWLATATWRSGRTVLPRVMIVVALVWFTVPFYEFMERQSPGGPLQWTTGGKIFLLFFAYHAAIVVALALLPRWLPRLRPARTPVR